jgi:hypothetical protein
MATCMHDRSRTHTKKLTRDANQPAKKVVDIASAEDGEATPKKAKDGKDPAAVSLGRRRSPKGGRARADPLSPEDRKKWRKVQPKPWKIDDR